MAHPSGPAGNSRGFSLLEVLVAIGLTGMLAVAIFTVFFGSQRATGGLNRVIENRQNSRTALQLIERDVRMAGSGWGRIPVEGAYDGDTLTLTTLEPGYGGSEAASDTLGMIGALDLFTTLSSAMTTVTSTIKVASATGFAVNDFVVVTNDATAHLFQITGISSNDLSHASSSKYNTTGGHINFPVGGYAAGAKVYRVTFISYKVDSTGGVRRLMRWQTGQPAQVVATGIGQFKISYLLQDGTLTRNPDDITTVDRVQPVIYTTASGAGLSRAVQDSAWASIKPRTF
jgi:prepilin-type N-terminal cleavage/methylation domain-containing protein